jgi:microcystin-dependent protein
MFMTYSDDNLGVVIKSDDQKNKKADGTGVTKGTIYFDSYIHGKGVVPVGAVISFGGTGTSGTPGWMLCDGRKLNKGTYPKLFSVLGYAHGGSGTYFNLPDIRGRVVAGYSTSSSLTSTLSNCNKMGNKQGAKTHTLSIAQMPKHRHGAGSGEDRTFSQSLSPFTWTKDDDEKTIYTKYEGGSQAHNNVQPTIVLHYFIRVL